MRGPLCALIAVLVLSFGGAGTLRAQDPTPSVEIPIPIEHGGANSAAASPHARAA
jgi:hypothetical protein